MILEIAFEGCFEYIDCGPICGKQGTFQPMGEF
jgi:hypothetical protein